VSAKLSSRLVGDVTVIDVSGRITLGEGSSNLRDGIRGLMAQGNKKLLLNLGDVSYIDSSGSESWCRGSPRSPTRAAS